MSFVVIKDIMITDLTKMTYHLCFDQSQEGTWLDWSKHVMTNQSGINNDVNNCNYFKPHDELQVDDLVVQ